MRGKIVLSAVLLTMFLAGTSVGAADDVTKQDVSVDIDAPGESVESGDEVSVKFTLSPGVDSNEIVFGDEDTNIVEANLEEGDKEEPVKESHPNEIEVDLKIVDRRGDPIEDALVELEDRGGSPDDRLAQTTEDGRVRFVENTGPPPANSYTAKVRLKDGGNEVVSLGSYNGGAVVERTIEVSRDQVETKPGNIFDHELKEANDAEIDANVVNSEGEPVKGATIEIEDWGDSTGERAFDNRGGQTDKNGQITIFDSLNSPPGNCMKIKLRLGEGRNKVAEIGCGGEPNFAVDITNTNSPVVEGDELKVNADITNTGDAEGTQDVKFLFEGEKVDSKSVSLGIGETEEVLFDYTTQEEDSGERTVEVRSDDDEDRDTVTIKEEVEIAIKPPEDPNPINPNREQGVIPVAILDSSEFDDVANVSVDEVRFGAPDLVEDGGGASPEHGGQFEDVDGDGDEDLILHFDAGQAGFDGDEEAGKLAGETDVGVPIVGTDPIKIVGGNPERGNDHQKEPGPP